MALLSALAALKQERQRRGLSLAELSQRSGRDKAMLSRLENGKVLNPTATTLWRYAEAVGMTLKLTADLNFLLDRSAGITAVNRPGHRSGRRNRPASAWWRGPRLPPSRVRPAF